MLNPLNFLSKFIKSNIQRELDKIDKMLNGVQFGVRKEEKEAKQFKRKKII